MLRRIGVVVLTIAAVLLVTTAPIVAQNGEDLLLVGATVIDGTGQEAVTDGWVLLRGNRIHAVGQGEPSAAPGAEVMNLEGKSVIPGLADMHVHLGRLENARWALKALLAHGVTVATGTGNRLRNIAAIREWAETQTAVPHYYGSNSALQGRADDLQFLGDGDEVEDAVEAYAAFGVDFIKTYNFLSTMGLAQTVELAAEYDIPIVGHTPLSGSSITAFDAGMTIMQHLRLRPYEVLDDLELIARYPIDELLMKRTAFWAHLDPDGDNVGQTLNLYAARKDKIFITPTVVTQEAAANAYDYPEPRSQFEGKPGVDFVSERTLARWQERMPVEENWGELTPEELSEAKRSVEGMATFVGMAYDRGVRILSGTDIGVPWLVPGISLHKELQYYVEQGGLTPEEAIHTSTGLAAEALRTPDRGTIEKGKVADLVIVDGNVAESITALGNIEQVILDGRVYSRSELMEEVNHWAARDTIQEDDE